MIEILGRIFPKIYHEKGWTVGSEILFVMGLILLIAICNFTNVVLQHSDKIPATAEGFGMMLLFTAIISFFPAVTFVWFRYYRLNHEYSRPAKVMETELAEELQTANEETAIVHHFLTLMAENGKDKVVLTPQNLCYIEADDNYVTVVSQEPSGKLKKELLRSSLSKVESQIQLTYIRRCHRSYMVNLQKVYKVSGNAQGYKLHLWQVAEPLPVSRGYAKQVVLAT
ncbi:LytR/AlgR family response regulator transcription factor [Runella limosa]|uniref:LytR/AlgR family response regulator transcription factor n=1 Tax=Runella limosa TaxID=370978 RepID=UPI00146FB923|nr:LytTR family DNA-binding domain-containing protein [Runella limosa]